MCSPTSAKFASIVTILVSFEAILKRFSVRINFKTVTMVIGSLLQILFFYLYNGPFHPFANILVDETETQGTNQ